MSQVGVPVHGPMLVKPSGAFFGVLLRVGVSCIPSSLPAVLSWLVEGPDCTGVLFLPSDVFGLHEFLYLVSS